MEKITLIIACFIVYFLLGSLYTGIVDALSSEKIAKNDKIMYIIFWIIIFLYELVITIYKIIIFLLLWISEKTAISIKRLKYNSFVWRIYHK